MRFGRGTLTLLNEAGDVVRGPFECTSFEIKPHEPEPKQMRSSTTITTVVEPVWPGKPVKTKSAVSERHRTLLRRRW